MSRGVYDHNVEKLTKLVLAELLTGKIVDADVNTITDIDNDEIKALAAIDVSKLANGSVTNAEFQYLGGVTSGIQGQLDSFVFGTQKENASSDAKDTTVLTSFQTKVTHTTASVPAGDYRVTWTADVGNTTGAAKMVVQFKVDGVVISENTYTGSGTDEYRSFSGFVEPTLTATTHTLTIAYKALTGTAEIKNAKISIYRLS